MSAFESRRRRNFRRIVVLVILALALVAGQKLRTVLGVEWSAESIQQTVRGLGLLAPLGFLVLVFFRQFFALPSMLVLTTAGLLFGGPLGTFLGGLGTTLNASLCFFVGRAMGAEWVFSRLRSRFPNFDQQTESAGPLVIAFLTGHPIGPQTAAHFTAGATTLSWLIFVVAVFPAALFRAGCYSFLGANILEPHQPRFWIASAALLVISVLPLAHPGLRARILSRPS